MRLSGIKTGQTVNSSLPVSYLFIESAINSNILHEGQLRDIFDKGVSSLRSRMTPIPQDLDMILRYTSESTAENISDLIQDAKETDGQLTSKWFVGLFKAFNIKNKAIAQKIFSKAMAESGSNPQQKETNRTTAEPNPVQQQAASNVRDIENEIEAANARRSENKKETDKLKSMYKKLQDLRKSLPKSESITKEIARGIIQITNADFQLKIANGISSRLVSENSLLDQLKMSLANPSYAKLKSKESTLGYHNERIAKIAVNLAYEYNKNILMKFLKANELPYNLIVKLYEKKADKAIESIKQGITGIKPSEIQKRNKPNTLKSLIDKAFKIKNIPKRYDELKKIVWLAEKQGKKVKIAAVKAIKMKLKEITRQKPSLEDVNDPKKKK